jgi:hypothetical protein
VSSACERTLPRSGAQEEGDDMISENSEGFEKTIWERIIKQNMVPLSVDGSQYVLKNEKNSAVEIHFGARYLVPPRQLSKLEPAVGRKSDTLDISSADFLVVNKNPTPNRSRQYIPWKKIREIVFLDAEP